SELGLSLRLAARRGLYRARALRSRLRRRREGVYRLAPARNAIDAPGAAHSLRRLRRRSDVRARVAALEWIRRFASRANWQRGQRPSAARCLRRSRRGRFSFFWRKRKARSRNAKNVAAMRRVRQQALARAGQRHVGISRKTAALHALASDVLGRARSHPANGRARPTAQDRYEKVRSRTRAHPRTDRARRVEYETGNLRPSFRQRRGRCEPAPARLSRVRRSVLAAHAANPRAHSRETSAASRFGLSK